MVMKRRILVLLAVVAVLYLQAAGTGMALAADEERPGGTTGGATVTNKYIWTGDTTRYGQVAVEYTINVVPGSQVYARWECRTRNGPTDYFAGNFSGWSGTVNAASFNGASMVLNDQDDYCAYHVWATTGGFQIPTATVLFWQQEFVGGGGTNPTPNPSQSSGPGTSVGGSPSPSPTPPPAVDDLIANGSPWVASWTGGVYAGALTAGFDGSDGTSYHSVSEADGMGVVFETAVLDSVTVPKCAVTGWKVKTGSQVSTVRILVDSTLVVVTDIAAGSAQTGTFGDGSPGDAVVATTWKVQRASGATGVGVDQYTFELYGYCDELGIDPETGIGATPSASPSPTPAPSGSPGTCEPGFAWSGTDCVAIPPPPPWYPSQPPALPTPSTGPNQGGNNGLEEPAPPNPNGNGVGPCEADDGLYSKPGQAPMQDLRDTSFPGSINPLDYIPPVMNMVSNLPIVIRNAGQTMVNTGVDFVVPGPCIYDLLTDGTDALMEKAPFSIPGDVQGYIEAELAAAGSAPLDLCATIASTEACIDLDGIASDLGPFRGLAGAVVWLLGFIGVYRIVTGTFGVRGARSEP